MRHSTEKRVFVISALFLAALTMFACGLAVGRYQVWPYGPIQAAWQAVWSYLRFGEVTPRGRLVESPRNASRSSLTVHLPERLGDGFYAIIGWDDQDKRYSAWLFPSDGAYRHRWPVAYEALDADGPSNRSDAPHAFHVMPDGSVIVGFDKGDLMVRLVSAQFRR